MCSAIPVHNRHEMSREGRARWLLPCPNESNPTFWSSAPVLAGLVPALTGAMVPGHGAGLGGFPVPEQMSLSICAKGALRGKCPHVEGMFNIELKMLLFVVKIFFNVRKALIYY